MNTFQIRRFFKSVLKKCYQMLRNTSIFSRLFLAFLFVIILPSIFLTNFIYKRVEKEFYTTGVNYIYQNLDVAVQKTYDKMLDYERIAQEYIEDGKLEELLRNSSHRDDIEEALYYLMQSNKVYNMFIITENDYYRPVETQSHAKGNLLISPENFRKSEVYRDGLNSMHMINWFNTKSQNDIYYGSDRKNSYLGNYLTMTCKLLDGKALLVFNIDIQKFSGLANISRLYGQDLFLIDAKGIITYLSNDFSYREYPEDIWEKLYENQEMIYEARVNHQKMLFLTQKLGKKDWYVVSILRRERLMQVSYDVRDIIVFVVAVTTIISLGICIMVTFSISYPLNRFKKAMSMYAKEDFYIEYEDTGKDQIAEVSSIFQGMVKRIRRLAASQVESEKQISREQLKQKEMYVSALQMQINPHFLYNMLDLIRWNIVHLESGNGRISRMMSSYSNLLRYNIRLGEGYATLKEEINYVEKYCSMLELLYEKNIILKIETNDIDTDKYKIGKLFFQPVIENTIIHGKLNTMEEPKIYIRIYKSGQILNIDICNNGRKLDIARAEEMNRQFENPQGNATSVGLLNVNQRIKLLFGEEYGLQIGETDGMVLITMRLPAVEE